MARTGRVSWVCGSCFALTFSGVLAIVGACTSSSNPSGSSGTDDGGYTVTSCPNGGALGSACASCIETSCAGELTTVNSTCSSLLDCACPLGVDAAACTASAACTSSLASAAASCTSCTSQCGLASDGGAADSAVSDSGLDAGPEDGSVTDAGTDAPATDASDASVAAARDASDAGPVASIFILQRSSSNGAWVIGYPADGNGGNPTEEFYSNQTINNGIDIGVDGAGYIYVLDQEPSGKNAVQVFAPGAAGTANPVRVISGAATTLGDTSVYSMSVGKDGTVYVNSNALVFAPGANGNVAPAQSLTILSGDGGYDTYNNGVATSASAIYAGGRNSIAIFPLNATGSLYATDTLTGPIGVGGVEEPVRLAVDPTTGNLLFTNASSQVFVFSGNAEGVTPPLQIINVASSALNGNCGLTVDSTGRLYVIGGSDSEGTGPLLDVYASGATGTPTPVLRIVGGTGFFTDPMGVATTL